MIPTASIGSVEGTINSAVRNARSSSLTVEDTAEYRLAGGSWIPVTGILTLHANDLPITAGSADTVLVARDCSVAPRGPGC